LKQKKRNFSLLTIKIAEYFRIEDRVSISVILEHKSMFKQGKESFLISNIEVGKYFKRFHILFKKKNMLNDFESEVLSSTSFACFEFIIRY